jgi:urease accessory protein
MQVECSSASSAVFAANRARGAVSFDVVHEDGVTRRGALHESGSLRLRFPSPEGEGLSAVLLNTAGGVAGGDRFDIAITAGWGTQLTLTTAAAEKVYRAVDSASELSIALKIANGAKLAWLPQETILFDRARLSRRIVVDLAEGASLLLCEITVFGRAAMGETMRQGAFIDSWRVRRGGKLIFSETVRLEGEVGDKLARPAIANGAAAIGTLLIAPADEALIRRLRQILPLAPSEVGLSAWNGFAMARFCAQDAARLRADIAAMLGQASDAPLPRLWHS